MNLNPRFFIIAGCLLFALISLNHSYNSTQEWDYNYELANTGDEFLTLIGNQNANIIRSRGDFFKYVEADPELRKVFKRANLKTKFSARMKFARGGLQTLHYGDLRNAYPRSYETILRRLAPGFGLSPDLFLTTDYDDMYCASTATCKTDTFSICIGSNC